MPVAVLVVTGVSSVALLPHDDVNATEIGTVAGAPFNHTSALTLVVP